MEHLSSSIELREDDIGGAQRPVDVLVGRPHGVRPHLHTHMHTAAEERQRHQNSSLEGIKRRRTLGGRRGGGRGASRAESRCTWMGRMAASSAERRLSKEPRMETTASVTDWLFCSDSRSNAARCARVSIAPPPPAAAAATAWAVASSSRWFQKVREGGGVDLGGRRETGWRRTPPTARREGRRGSNCSCSGGGWGLLSAAGKESEEGGRGTAAESKCKCLSRGPPDAGLSSPVQPWTACLLLGGSYTGTGTLQVVAHGSILHFLSPNVIFFLFFLII